MRTRPSVIAALATRRLRRGRRARDCRPDADEDHAAGGSVVHHLPRHRASGLAVTGTSNGKSDKVDLRCDGTIALVLKPGLIPNAAGVFSTTVVRCGHGEARRAVLRAARRAGRLKPTTSPSFAGPRLLVGDVHLVTVKGGPSNGAVVDYRVRAPQLSGRGGVRVDRQLRRRGIGDVLGDVRHLGRHLRLLRAARQHDRCAVRDPGRRCELVHLGRRRLALHVPGAERQPARPDAAGTRGEHGSRPRATPPSASPRSSSSAPPTQPPGPSTRRRAPASRPPASGSTARSRRAATGASPR